MTCLYSYGPYQLDNEPVDVIKVELDGTKDVLAVFFFTNGTSENINEYSLVNR